MSRSRRVVLLTGLPIGTLIALTTLLGSRPNWVDFVVTALVCTAIIGAVAAGATSLCVTHVRRSAVTIMGYLLLMVVIGVVVTVAVYVPMRWLPHGGWEQLPPPPEAIRELLGPPCYAVTSSPKLYIRVNSGRLFVIPNHLGAQSWERVDSVPAGESGYFRRGCEMIRRPPFSPLAPGRVVSSYWVELHGVDTGGRLRYVLLGNGTVWRWETFGSSLAEVGLFFFLVCFAATWFFTVALLVAVRKPPFGWARTGTAASALPIPAEANTSS
jgi:hypothetical protein